MTPGPTYKFDGDVNIVIGSTWYKPDSTIQAAPGTWLIVACYIKEQGTGSGTAALRAWKGSESLCRTSKSIAKNGREWFNCDFKMPDSDATITVKAYSYEGDKDYEHDSKCCWYLRPTLPITCDDPTPSKFDTGCDLLKYFDADHDGIISATEKDNAWEAEDLGYITSKEAHFVEDAYNAGSINALCPGCYVAPSLEISPTAHNSPAVGDTFKITVTSNIAWTVVNVDDLPWISFTPASGSGDGTITVTIAENLYAERTGTIRVTGSGIKRTCTITQASGLPETCDQVFYIKDKDTGKELVVDTVSVDSKTVTRVVTTYYVTITKGGTYTLKATKEGYNDLEEPFTEDCAHILTFYMTKIVGCTVKTDKDTYAIGDTVTITYTDAPPSSTLYILDLSGVYGKTWTGISGNGKETYTLADSDPTGTWKVGLYDTDCGVRKYITVIKSIPEVKEAVNEFYKKTSEESWSKYIVYANQKKSFKAVDYNPEKEGCPEGSLTSFVDGPNLSISDLCDELPEAQKSFITGLSLQLKPACFWYEREGVTGWSGASDCYIWYDNRPLTADELWLTDLKQRAIDLGYDVRECTDSLIGWGFYGSTKEDAWTEYDAFIKETGVMGPASHYVHDSGYVWCINYVHAYTLYGITEPLKEKKDTKLTCINATKTAKVGDTIDLEVKLEEAAFPYYDLEGKAINYYKGDSETPFGTCTKTDSDGKCSVQYICPIEETFTVTAKFEGDTDYNSSSCTFSVTVSKHDTVICDFDVLDPDDNVVTDLVAGVQYWVRAWLCKVEGGGCAEILKGCDSGCEIPSEDLKLFLFGQAASVASGTTNENGYTAFAWTPKETDFGKHDAKLKFGVTTDYNPCESGTKTIKVYKGFGSVYVTSAPSDAEIWLKPWDVDEEYNTDYKTPNAIGNVPAGPCVVYVKKKGYKDAVEIVEIEKDGTAIVDVTLEEGAYTEICNFDVLDDAGKAINTEKTPLVAGTTYDVQAYLCWYEEALYGKKGGCKEVFEGCDTGYVLAGETLELINAETDEVIDTGTTNASGYKKFSLPVPAGQTPPYFIAVKYGGKEKYLPSESDPKTIMVDTGATEYKITVTVKDENDIPLVGAYVDIDLITTLGTHEEKKCTDGDVTVVAGECKAEEWKGDGYNVLTNSEGKVVLKLPKKVSIPAEREIQGWAIRVGKPGYLNETWHEDWSDQQETDHQPIPPRDYAFEFKLSFTTAEDTFIVHTRGFEEGDVVLCAETFSHCWFIVPFGLSISKSPDAYPDGKVVFTKADGLVEGKTYAFQSIIKIPVPFPTGYDWCGVFTGTKEPVLGRYGSFGNACKLMGIEPTSDECLRFWSEMIDPIYVANCITGVFKGVDVYDNEYHPGTFELAMLPIVVGCSLLPFLPGAKITKFLGRFLKEAAPAVVKHGDDILAVRKYFEDEYLDIYRIQAYGDDARLENWAKAIDKGTPEGVEEAKGWMRNILDNPAVTDATAVDNFNSWLDELTKQIDSIDPARVDEIADLRARVIEAANACMDDVTDFTKVYDEKYPEFIDVARRGSEDTAFATFVRATDNLCSPAPFCKLNQIMGLIKGGKLPVGDETLDLLALSKALHAVGYTPEVAGDAYTKVFRGLADLSEGDVIAINNLIYTGNYSGVLSFLAPIAAKAPDKKSFLWLFSWRPRLLETWGKVPANKSAAGSGFGHDFWRSTWAGIKNKTPWRKVPDDISDVLTTGELEKLLDAGTMDKIATKLDSEGRYADPSELFRYVIQKDPEFFKKGYSNALMKKFEHYDDVDDIAKHINPLTPEQAAERRNWFKNLREEFKTVLGDERGEEVFEKLGMDAIEEAADLNHLFWLYGKLEFDNVFNRALSSGASDEVAEELAKLALGAKIDVAEGFSTGTIKTGKALQETLWAKVKAHPVLSLFSSFAVGLGAWYMVDNFPFYIFMGKKAGVIEKNFGDQFEIVNSKLEKLGYQIRDRPCDPVAQQNYVDMLTELKRLKDISDVTGVIDPNKIQEAIDLYSTVYGISIGKPNEFMSTMVDVAWLSFVNEYTVNVRGAGCIAPIEPPGGWPVSVDVPRLDEVITATVLKHDDADTFYIRHAGMSYCVRVAGINSPEGPSYFYSCKKKKKPFLVRRLITPGEECISEELWSVDSVFYAQANAWFANQLPYDTNITLKSDSNRQWDLKHVEPRLVATVFKGTTDIGREELKEGYAVVFFYDLNKQVDRSDYKDVAEKVASDKKTRIWDPKWPKECPATEVWYNYTTPVRVNEEATFTGFVLGCDPAEITDWTWTGFPDDVVRTGREVKYTYSEEWSSKIYLEICAGALKDFRTITVKEKRPNRESPCIPFGNVNGDAYNYVNDLDAALVQRYIEKGWDDVKSDVADGIDETEFKKRADVNGDNEVDSTDLNEIYMFYDGTIDTFDVCPEECPPPPVDFSFTPTSPIVGQEVLFTCKSSGGNGYSIAKRKWDFGDGTGDEDNHELVTHTYSKAEKYDVYLTVTNDCETGESKTKKKTITVSEKPIPPPPKGDLTIEIYESRDFETALGLVVDKIFVDGTKVASGTNAHTVKDLLVSANPHVVKILFKTTPHTCYADIPDECYDPCDGIEVNVVADTVTTLKMCPARSCVLTSNCAATIYAKLPDTPDTEYEDVGGAHLMPLGTYVVKFVKAGYSTVVGYVTVRSTGVICEVIEIPSDGTCYPPHLPQPSEPLVTPGIYVSGGGFVVKGLLKALPTKTVTFESMPIDATVEILD